MGTTSWVEVPRDSHFPIQNLPYGIFSTSSDITPRIGVAIGDHVLDLKVVSQHPLLARTRAAQEGVFKEATLNKFLGLGGPAWKEARAAITQLLSNDGPNLQDDEAMRKAALVPQDSVKMHLPAQVGDFTDFYTCMEHAKNGAGIKSGFRVLTPNWVHMPVAYHSRSSSIVPSGTDVHRPWGQALKVSHQGASALWRMLASWVWDTASEPVEKPTAAFDYELEMGCLIGPGNEMGEPISVDSAADHIFGVVLLNDWSARDFQRWEMFPLGPFNSKNFATSISPWVVTLDALEPFRRPAPEQTPAALPYLQQPDRTFFDIELEASLRPNNGDETVVTRTNFRQLHWSFEQMIAHHTFGGCNLRPGDILGTGTISSPGPGGQGCLMELTWGGSKPIELKGGSTRSYLVDGDTVAFKGFCQGHGYKVGFGECVGTVLPAPERQGP